MSKDVLILKLKITDHALSLGVLPSWPPSRPSVWPCAAPAHSRLPVSVSEPVRASARPRPRCAALPPGTDCAARYGGGVAAPGRPGEHQDGGLFQSRLAVASPALDRQR